MSLTAVVLCSRRPADLDEALPYAAGGRKGHPHLLHIRRQDQPKPAAPEAFYRGGAELRPTGDGTLDWCDHRCANTSRSYPYWCGGLALFPTPAVVGYQGTRRQPLAGYRLSRTELPVYDRDGILLFDSLVIAGMTALVLGLSLCHVLPVDLSVVCASVLSCW